MHYFCHIEIMSDKKEDRLSETPYHCGMRSAEFPDVGKLRQVGHTAGFGAGRICSHIPYHVTWQYETHDGDIAHPNFIRLKNITDIMEYLL